MSSQRETEALLVGTVALEAFLFQSQSHIKEVAANLEHLYRNGMRTWCQSSPTPPCSGHSEYLLLKKVSQRGLMH